ncbi:MAG TPA: CHAD domain-containing protein [Candidatus Binataceae bacterium]
MRKFTALLPKVLAEDGVEAVHDLRVWSRRLQQVVTTLSPAPHSAQTRTIVRALRRARRALGGWRDCDVMIELLERKARRVRDPEEKMACAMIRDLAQSKRDREIRRARRRLSSRKLFTLAHRAHRFLRDLPHGDSAAGQGPADAAAVIAASAAAGYRDWRAALARACDGFDPLAIHAFRIATKRLRYRIELARDLGAHDAAPALDFLRSMQDVLGAWHDQIELLGLTAEALADPEFLLSHARLVAIVLRKADSERSAQNARVRRLLAETAACVEGSALNHWIASYCAGAPAGHGAPASQAHESDTPRESGEPGPPRHASAHANEMAPLPSAPEQMDPAAAPHAAETPDAAVSPEDNFVKAITLLPR